MILEIKLNNGRRVFLANMHLSRTYGGQIEGGPTAEGNRTILGWHGFVTDTLWPSVPARVLGLECYTANLHRHLPEFRFIGEFKSLGPVLEQRKAASRLVVVWYQEETHPFLSERNAEWLKTVDWDKSAIDFNPF
jgi:hypothetical protein